MIKKIKTGEMSKLAAQPIQPLVDYEVTDKPEGGITNAQMTAALTTTEGFYIVGSVYTCTDDGEYTAKHQYKFNGADALLPWEDVTPESVVDQEYDPTSQNAQSGIAVNEAVSGKATKSIITLTGESGVLTDEEIAKVLNDNEVVEFNIEGDIYRFSEKQTNYVVYSSITYPTTGTKEEKVIYIQTSSGAVNYKHWSFEEENGDKPIVTQNVQIASGDWISESVGEYNYSAEIEVEGATDKDVSIITFNEDDADSGDLSSICDTTDGAVTIYSKVARAITIPVILTIKTNKEREPMYAPIYGVEWTNDATTTMTRTDDAEDMTYAISGGRVASDFDNVFPYNQMKRTTIGSNVFVKIPSMWFRVGYDNDGKVVSVAVSETQGPAKTEAGVTYVWHQTREFYYGAYGASSNNTALSSVSGVSRKYSITRAQARTQARAVGTGCHQRDLYAGTILMFLWWIEFATKNSYSVMQGTRYGNTTGGTDSFYNETAGDNFCVSGYNTSNSQMVWHGIEDYIGNGLEWEDGITGNGTSGGAQYVSDDYTKYDDYNNGSQMDLFPYSSPASGNGNCLESIGWDDNHPFLIQPLTVRNDSSYATGFCDYANTSNNIVSYRGAETPSTASSGVSYFLRSTRSALDIALGCRLVYEGGI